MTPYHNTTDYPCVELTPIPECPGYLACRLGVIFTLYCHQISRRGFPVPLTPNVGGNGYHYVTLFVNKVRIRKAVHHLMLETFVGPRPERHQTRHLNNIRGDNRISNLAWGTSLENGRDRVLANSAKDRNYGSVKLTDKDVQQIIAMRWEDAASRFGITRYHYGKFLRRKC